ncbi:YrrS family protein [Oceanobacillus halotolerans]|uniref:YrrS family protein n=1 Tax=Oceanobacillus halotolerans TaxID=2663380 RepID=UPI0013D92649|nr:YrrS family protein [Oceanobacillus halotolerans]
MSNFDRYSRVNKFEKRRKNTKSISIFLVTGSVLLLLLVGIWIFGDNDQEASTAQNDSPTYNEEENHESSSEDNNSIEVESSEESSEAENTLDDDEREYDESVSNQEQVELEEVETDDDNVSHAFTGNWQPVGTEQEGPHTTVFDEESQDWKEMREAVLMATGLTEDNLIEWRYENGGDQKVIATVSDLEETEIYRVYLSWIDEQGWKPTRVEILIENDKKD